MQAARSGVQGFTVTGLAGGIVSCQITCSLTTAYLPASRHADRQPGQIARPGQEGIEYQGLVPVLGHARGDPVHLVPQRPTAGTSGRAWRPSSVADLGDATELESLRAKRQSRRHGSRQYCVDGDEGRAAPWLDPRDTSHANVFRRVQSPPHHRHVTSQPSHHHPIPDLARKTQSPT